MAVAHQHPDRADLEAFSLGTLDDSASVEAHVADCPTCQDRAADTPCDPLVESLRGVHARMAHRADTLTEMSRTPTPSPALAMPETIGLPSAGSEDAAAGAPLPSELAGHDRYRIVRLLGKGGMGEVYEAEHRVMRRAVALKVIHRAFMAGPAAADRFRREVRAASRLSHPNVVTTHDAEDVGDRLFLVMEFVEGVTLGSLVRDRGPLPVAEACDCARQAALGLQHAHERGMVHRDIKPDNLIRCADGTVKILDFGLAALTGDRGSGGLTDANLVMGTPDYMAPEQAEDAHTADIRADVYSLGCTLYYLLTGKIPYPAATGVLKILAHRERPLPSMGTAVPGLPELLARMLAKKPEDRFATPGDVAAALGPFAAPRPAVSEAGTSRRPPRRRPLIASLAALLLVGAAIAGAVEYRIRTDKGELLITTQSDDVEVVVKQGGKLVRIIDTKTEKQVALTLRSGVYELELKGTDEGLKLEIDRATVKRGETVLAKIERVDRKPQEKLVEVRRFVGHQGSVRCVAYSPDGRYVLSGGGYADGDATARLWDVRTGKEIRKFVHGGWVNSVAISPDSRRFISGTPDGTIHLWDVGTGKEIRRLVGHGGWILSLAFSPDGHHVLSGGGEDRTARLWNADTGKEVRRFVGHTGQVFSVAFTPDGKWALSGGADKTIRVWDVETGKRVQVLEGHGGAVFGLAVAPDGRHVLSGNGEEKTIRLWDLNTGKQVREFQGQASGLGLAFSHDGRRAISGGKSKTLCLWDVETGKELRHFEGHTGMIWAVAYSPDDRYALSGSADNTVRLWRLPDPPPAKAKGVKPPPETKSPERLAEVRRFVGHQGSVRCVAYSPDGRYVLSASGWPTPDRTIRLWDVTTGKEVRRFEGRTFNGAGLAFSPDGRRALSTSYNFIRLWDVATGKEVHRFDVNEDEITAVAFSPDGRFAASGGMGQSIRIWDLKARKEVRNFEAKGHNVVSLAYSPDGRHVASGNGNKDEIHVWEVETGKELSRFRGSNVAYSPDGKFLLSGSTTGGMSLREAETGKEVRSFGGLRADDDSWVASVAFSPDGSRVLSAGADKTLRLWEAGTGKLLARAEGHHDTIWGCAFSPDGRYAISGGGGHYRGYGHWVPGSDYALRLWRLPDPPAAKAGP